MKETIRVNGLILQYIQILTVFVVIMVRISWILLDSAGLLKHWNNTPIRDEANDPCESQCRSKEENSKKVYINFADCFLIFDCFLFYGGLCLAIFFVFSLFCRGGYYALTQCFNVHSKFSFKVFEFLGKQDEKYIPFLYFHLLVVEALRHVFKNLYFQ